MGRIVLTLGISAAVLIGSLFGLWRGALGERNQARENLKAANERIASTEQLVRDWADKYDELNTKYLDSAVQGALAAERESAASAAARTANSRLAALRQVESPVSEPCSSRIVRSLDGQRVRNDEASRLVSALAGPSVAATALDTVRLPAGSGTLLPDPGS